MKHRSLFMIAYFIPILLFGIYNTALSHVTPDTCLKLFPENPPWVTNPDSARIDSCPDSPYYDKIFVKGLFLLNFKYNIIPRNYTAPMDTIIEYTWHDILAKYPEAISEYSALEQEFGKFYFREFHPEYPDTSSISKLREFFIRFEEWVPMDVIIEKLETFNSSHSVAISASGAPRFITKVEDGILSTNDISMEYLNGELIIGNDKDVKNIGIYSILGSLLYSNTSVNRNLDISFLPNGVYFVHINSKIFKILITK